jgi:hypothetical protein
MRGFKGFRKPEAISDDALKNATDRYADSNRFIYWTGNPYNARRQSLRSNSLKALTVAKIPVPLADWVRLAARVVDQEAGIGYDPASVRAGLYLHRDSKPAVYIELKKRADGAYVSVNEMPNADGFPKGLKPGDVVIPAEEKAEPAQIEASGKVLIETAASKGKRNQKRLTK